MTIDVVVTFLQQWEKASIFPSGNGKPTLAFNHTGSSVLHFCILSQFAIVRRGYLSECLPMCLVRQ